MRVKQGLDVKAVVMKTGDQTVAVFAWWDFVVQAGQIEIDEPVRALALHGLVSPNLVVRFRVVWLRLVVTYRWVCRLVLCLV